MSVRLTALTTPCNSKWTDIIVVADGSDTVGYSLTEEHWDYVKDLKNAVENICGISVDDLTEVYNNSASITRDFYLKGEGEAKESFSAEIDKDIINSIFRKAYMVVDGKIPLQRMDLSYLRGRTFWKTMKKL